MLTLRGVAKGFDASEGVNLRDLREGNMPSAVKAKINRYFHEYQAITAQEKIEIRTRSPRRLEYAKRVGGMDPKYKFKVAFVPGSAKSRVVWNEDGSLTIRERGRGYEKIPLMFDAVELATHTKAEVERVTTELADAGAQRFILMAGENLRISKPVTAGALYRMVVSLMNRYDGVSALPSGSGNAGDAPGAHRWDQWMYGVMGFAFDADPDETPPEAFYEIERRNKALQKDRANARRRDEYDRKHKRGAYAVVKSKAKR